MKFSLAKWIGITAVVIGAICTWEAVFEPFSNSIVEGNPRFFVFGFSLIIFAPFYLAVYCGFMTIHQPSKKNIPHAVGMLLAMAVFYGASEISSAVDANWGTGDSYTFALFGLTFLAIPIYAALTKAAFRSENIEYEGLRDLFSKAFGVVIALLAYGCTEDLFKLFWPEKGLADPMSLSENLSFVIPILVGITFYKVFAAMVGLVPRDLDHFLSARFTLFISFSVWIIATGLFDSGERPDGRAMFGAFVAAVSVYPFLRIIARAFSKSSQPVSPLNA